MTDKKWRIKNKFDGYPGVNPICLLLEGNDRIISNHLDCTENEANLIAAATEIAVERDQLKAVNAELVCALEEYQLANPIHNDSEAELYDLAKAAIAKSKTS